MDSFFVIVWLIAIGYGCRKLGKLAMQHPAKTGKAASFIWRLFQKK